MSENIKTLLYCCKTQLILYSVDVQCEADRKAQLEDVSAYHQMNFKRDKLNKLIAKIDETIKGLDEKV